VLACFWPINSCPSETPSMLTSSEKSSLITGASSDVLSPELLLHWWSIPEVANSHVD
jgi:hypothetical protein